MRSLFFLLLVILTAGKTFAQCPVASFAIDDSICANTQLVLQNQSSGGTAPLNYQWDFASGDYRNPIGGSIAGTYPGVVNASLGVELIYDGSNYFGFVANTYGALVRLDFGPDFNNTPVMTNLGNVDGIMGGMFDINIVQSGTDWYGYYHTSGTALIKLYFGNSLTNIPVSTVISMTGGTFSGPYYADLIFDGQNYFYLVANQSGNNISVVNLGSNLSSGSATVNNIPVAAARPLSFTAGKDCDQWYGIVGYENNNSLSRIDFGTSLTNSSPNVVTINPSPSAGTTREMELISEGGNWYLTVNTLDGNNMSVLNFGPNLTGIPAAQSYGTFGVIAVGDYCHTLKKINSQVIGLSVNYGSGQVSRITFAGNTASPRTSTQTSPAVSFNTTGWHFVTLDVTDNNGNRSSNTDSIYVKPAPLAGFTYTPVCENTVFQLTDTSTSIGSIQSWYWDFGDSGNSSLQNPQHTYASVDSFLILLQVTGDNGCQSSKTDTIEVATLPVAAAVFTPSSCERSPVLFTDNSTVVNGTIVDWNWAFENGATGNTPQLTSQFDTAGTYMLELAVTSSAGCRDTFQSSITVIPSPLASYSVSNTCLGDSVQFNNQTAFNGTGSLNCFWDFGDGNSSSIFSPKNYYGSSAGSWNTQLIAEASNGCRDTSNLIVSLSEKALPAFSVSTDTACVGNAIQFTDNSVAPASGTISYLFWDFGDGDTSSGPSVSHVYQNTGNYVVSLTVRTPTSCDTSVSYPVFVIASPLAEFTTSNVCFGDSAHFSDLSVPPAGSIITEWHWDFGDQDSSDSADPSHYYNSPGVFTVQLLVTSDRGCFDLFTDSVKVNAMPVAAFGYTKACTGKTISFTDSSTVSNDSIHAWSWDFGDLSGSVLQNPQHLYSQAGLYTVSLISTSTGSCSDTISKFIIVNQSPEHSITGTDACLGTNSYFTSTIMGATTDTIGYVWNFGDNSFSTSKNPVHNYFLPGNFTVTLTTTNLVNSCNADTSVNIDVYALPVAGFTSTGSCINAQIAFTDTSKTGSAPLTSWNWNFGNGGTSTVTNPVVTFNTAGITPLKLTVTDQNGCKDSISRQFTVNPLPLVSAIPSVSSGIPPLPVTFTNTSSPGTYTWDFDDGSALSNTASPSHIFSDSGTYSVTLVTTSAAGCIDSADFNILVMIPYLDLGIDNISFVKVNGSWEMKAQLRNTGNLTISECRLQAQLEGKSTFNEYVAFSAPLQPGSFISYTFNTSLIAGENESPDFFCVNIRDVNNETDQNEENDERCISSTNDFSIINITTNPGYNSIQLTVNVPVAGDLGVTIWDYNGKLLYQENYLNYPQGFSSLNIDANGIASGIYLMQVSSNEKDIIQKFLRP
jgi:PKD repeat protein